MLFHALTHGRSRPALDVGGRRQIGDIRWGRGGDRTARTSTRQRIAAARHAAPAAATERPRPRAGADVKGGRLLTVRERMEEHRASPACSSCHRVIDPFGLALEHFDVTGHYRIKDNGQPIDSSGSSTTAAGLAGCRVCAMRC